MNWIQFLVSSLVVSVVASQESRIVGGFDVQPEFKYPWMVAIYRYGDYWCGGTLLTTNKVLTAAHCMAGTVAPLENYEVQLHRHDLTKEVEEEGGKVYKVIRRWVPKTYNRDTLYDDIAIIELDNKINKLSSIVLNTKDNFKAGFRVTALGWGARKVMQAPYPILQEVWLPLTDSNTCSQTYKKMNYTVQTTQICTGSKKGGRDTCKGDSGGPLFTYVNDKPTLIGITSNGVSCAQPDVPAIYTKISKFTSWINNVIKGRIEASPTTDPFV